ncbi:hypothetical protein PFISCL1PPCAC_5602, partial [Pristionchus fissidentatus]
LMAEGKKKKVPKEQEIDPIAGLAKDGAWILYPLLGGMHSGVKCQIVCYCEIALSFLFAVLGFCNIKFLSEIASGYVLIIYSLLLFCLFVEAFFGYRYRSTTLLYLHTIQCVFASFMLIISVIFSLALIDPEEVTGKDIRQSISDIQTSGVSVSVILLTFGSVSYTRARELIKVHRDLPRHALGGLNIRLREAAGIGPE